jgi:hypothetical protein
VAVKCKSGSGTTTTHADGSYKLELKDGALPCVIRVSGTQRGVAVTLHSLVATGSTDTATKVTSATAHVTPLTEMIMAQLTARQPAAFFSAFDSTPTIPGNLTAAINAVLSALKSVTGIDFGKIDPFTGDLAASSGKGYDALLDQLGAKMNLTVLPLIVTQIATAATNGDSRALGDAMTPVENSSLAGCPSALSGTYRTINYYGFTGLRDLNFKTMKVHNASDGSVVGDITADAKTPCEFGYTAPATVGDTVQLTSNNAVMGSAGVGAMRNQTSTGALSPIYIFPAQSHTVSELVGEWTFLRSGYSGPDQRYRHWLGKYVIQDGGGVTVCNYDYVNGDYSACTPDTAIRSITVRTDGGFDLLKNGAEEARLYGYRSPDGRLTVFATTNPTGVSGNPTVEQTSMVLAQLRPLTVPAVGTVNSSGSARYVSLVQTGTTRNVVIGAVGSTVLAVNGNTATTSRDDPGNPSFAGVKFTTHYNEPLTGMSTRDAIAGISTAQNNFFLPGIGAVVINADSTNPSHLYVISVNGTFASSGATGSNASASQ